MSNSSNTYDVVKDWEGIDFEPLELAVKYAPDWHHSDLADLIEALKDLRDKQLKTFPKLERK